MQQDTLFDLRPLTKKARYHNPNMPGQYIYGDARTISLDQLGCVPFKAMIIDPPWDFGVYDKNTGNGKGPKYDLMTLEDILAMPIKSLAAPDCVLYLWSTNPFMPEALECLKAWQFKYRTKFSWIKTTQTHRLDYGTGYWVRGVSEDVMIATRGNISAPRLDGFLGLIGPNVEHSRKPQDVHFLAESTTPGPYLEIFSRYQRPGWVCFGNDNRGLQPADLRPSRTPSWLK